MEFKTTDELFQRLPTRDIRAALIETQREVASKQEALKALVGDRYPDLMESVDDTIAMFHTVENLQKLLADLHTNCASMTQAFEAPLLIRKPSESSLGSPRTAVQPDQPRTLPFISKRLLKELASFVETIWERCDERKWYSAIVGVVAAACLASGLRTAAQSQDSSSPTLIRQANERIASLHHFPRHILASCHSAVRARRFHDASGLAKLFATIWLIERCEPSQLVFQLLSAYSAMIVPDPPVHTSPEIRLTKLAAAIRTALHQACSVVHGTSTMFTSIKEFQAAVNHDVTTITRNCGLNEAEVKLVLPWLQSSELWPVAVQNGLSAIVATVDVSTDAPTSTSVQASIQTVVSSWLRSTTDRVAAIATNALAGVESPQEVVAIRRAVHEACGSHDQYHHDTVVYEYLLSDPHYSLWNALFQRQITEAACSLITASFQEQITVVEAEIASQCHNFEAAILSAKQDAVLTAPMDVSVTPSEVVHWYNTASGDAGEEHVKLPLDAAVDVSTGLQSSLGARLAVVAWSVAQLASRTITATQQLIQDVFPDAPAASHASYGAQLLDDPVVLARSQIDATLQEFVRALEGLSSEHGRRSVSRTDDVKAYVSAWICALLSRVSCILCDEPAVPSDCRSQLQRLGLQCAACWCHAISTVLTAGISATTTDFLRKQAEGGVHGHAVISVPIASGDDSVEDAGSSEGKPDDVEIFLVPSAPSSTIARMLSTLCSCLVAADAVWLMDGEGSSAGNVDDWGMPMRGKFVGKSGTVSLRGLLSGAHSHAAAVVNKVNESTVHLVASMTYGLAIEAIGSAVSAYQSMQSAAVPSLGWQQLLFDVQVLQALLSGAAPATASFSEQIESLTAVKVALLSVSPPPVDAVWSNIEGELDVVDWQMTREYLQYLVQEYLTNSGTLFAPLISVNKRQVTAPVKVTASFLNQPTSSLPFCPQTVKFPLLPIPSKTATSRRGGRLLALTPTDGTDSTSSATPNSDGLKAKLSAVGQMVSGWSAWRQ